MMIKRFLFILCLILPLSGVSLTAHAAADATVSDDVVELIVYGHHFLIPREYWDDQTVPSVYETPVHDILRFKFLITDEGKLVSAQGVIDKFHLIDNSLVVRIAAHRTYIRTFEELYDLNDEKCWPADHLYQPDPLASDPTLIQGLRECPYLFPADKQSFKAWYRGHLLEMDCDRPGTVLSPHCQTEIDIHDNFFLGVFTPIENYDQPIDLLERVRERMCAFHTAARKGKKLAFCQ